MRPKNFINVAVRARDDLRELHYCRVLVDSLSLPRLETSVDRSRHATQFVSENAKQLKELKISVDEKTIFSTDLIAEILKRENINKTSCRIVYIILKVIKFRFNYKFF